MYYSNVIECLPADSIFYEYFLEPDYTFTDLNQSAQPYWWTIDIYKLYFDVV